MGASQRRERRIIKRLNAQRDPVDPGGPVTFETPRFHTGGIGLKRHLDIIRYAPIFGDGIEDRRNRCGLHQGWRSAAKEDCGRSEERRARGRCGDLSRERPNEALLIDEAMPDMTVEIAIGTL